jgi:ribokinase
MVSESFRTLEKLALFAEKNKIRIAFNPSPYLAKKGAGFLKKILNIAEILVLNHEEAVYISGKKDIKNILEKLSSFGPNIVVITNGKNDINAYDKKNFYVMKPHNLKVVESTGAGDAFASSFVSGIIKKNDVESALKIALANSESVITHPGAKNKLLSYREVLNKIKKNPVKIKKFKR